jgi:hypothetical protein
MDKEQRKTENEQQKTLEDLEDRDQLEKAAANWSL